MKKKKERGRERRGQRQKQGFGTKDKKICEIKSEKLIYKSEEAVDNDGRQLQSV